MLQIKRKGLITIAGILHFEEFQDENLRGLIDESEKERESTLGDRFLPDVEIFENEFAYDLVKGNNYLAPMIGYGAEPPIVDRNAYSKMQGSLGKMGIKHIVTETELLKLNQSRTQMEQRGMIDTLLVDALDLVEAVRRQINVQKMTAITKGFYEQTQNKLKIRVPFAIPDEHKVALSPGADWDAEGHDIVGDLLGFVETYTNTNGSAPEAILVSRQLVGKIQANAMMIAEAGRPETARRISIAEVNAVLQDNGLPALTIVDDRRVTVKNFYTGEQETIEVMPENRVVFVSQGVGEYYMGPTVENDFAPGIFLGAFDERSPIRSGFEAVAAGFPALKNPGLLFHADVYTV